MASVSQAALAKSDQLNFIDIGANRELLLFITGVDVKSTGSQDVIVWFEGCNGKPYKPNKGMIRVFSECWGDESDNWVGKFVKLYGDPTVAWAGKAVGGLVIRALSDIDKGGQNVFVQKNRKTRVEVHFNHHEIVLTDIDRKWVDSVKKTPSVIDQLTDAVYRFKIENFIKRGF